MQSMIVTLSESIPFKANSEVGVNLPLEGLITRIALQLKLTVATDATNGGVPAEDALARILKAIRLEVPGGRLFYAADGLLTKYANIVDGIKVHEDELPTAAGATATVTARYVLTFGYNPKNPWDTTVPLPAELLSNLRLVILWGDATSLGTGYTISDGEVKVTLYKLALDEGERIDDYYPYGLPEPIMETTKKSIDAVYSDLGLRIDMPTGNVLRDAIIVVRDAAGNRSDDEVTELAVQNLTEGRTIIRTTWFEITRRTADEAHLDAPIRGVAVLNGGDISGVDVGADLSDYRPGELVTAFTTARSGGSIEILWRQVTIK